MLTNIFPYYIQPEEILKMSRTTSDLLRLLSIIAVLLIHGSSWGEWQWVRHHAPSMEVIAAVLTNQLARFCVPVFIFLSGFGLCLKYRKTWLKDSDVIKGAPKFYAERAYQIGLPFLIISLSILVLKGKFVDSMTVAGFLQNLAILWNALYFQPVIYHFYFFTAILQCYLLFPFVIGLAQKRSAGLLFWFVLLAVELVFCSPSAGWFASVDRPLPNFPSSSPVYWMFWFYSGMIFAVHSAAIAKAVSKIPAGVVLFVAAAAFGGLLWEYLFRASYQNDPGYFNHFSRWVVIPYTISVIAVFVKFDDLIRGFIESRAKLFVFVKAMVGVSFPVYIWHVWLLEMLRKTFLVHGFFLLCAVLVLVSFAVMLIVDRLLKRPRILRVMIGL